ncbi:hypothetical protein [Burkholderia guangdongensis]|uniref:hypothetical protein n=1 Tax=Burkholderia guangdongensis TaxID=1792500 RepID=UPI0015CD3B27|nr:hypothetical protein [Burkholderia guangdongensis]
MSVYESIIKAESDILRNAWVKPASPGAAVRLPWPQDKLQDPNQFFDPLWDLARKFAGPICYTRSTNNNLDYGGWFNYFFAEAKPSATGNADIGRMLGRILSLMFDLKVVGAGRTAKLTFAEDFPLSLASSFYGLLERKPRAIPRAILGYLFEIGFEEATTTQAGDYFAENLALKSNMPDGVAIRSSKGEFVFGYRGDTRDLPTIIKQGARCRAELDFWRKNCGVDQAWHPWNSGDEKWKKMWFRKGSKDNDYFTMNSLAKEFHISCAYPMFRSYEIDQRLRGPVSGWGADLRALLGPKKVKVVTVRNKKKGGKLEEVLSDETRVFACAIASGSLAAETFKLAQYPESAVRNVNLEDMLAWIRVRRYHRPPDGPDDHYDSTRVDPSMTIKVIAWGWVRTEDETRASLGCTQSGIKAIGAKLQNLVGKMFDISHTTYYQSTTYDVDSVGPVTPPTVTPTSGVQKPVRLSTR